ncbi:hypothetical protein QYM36_007020 [Artemia franciscana]|uniref:Myosin tail domain-containing protein n=1 Tax=Artemia franciscana TaxID=6661 RepID=A0AA88LCV1_ARTSF|nr:hypothetical protein QYM36_007020 [Artemia franciscana]
MGIAKRVVWGVGRAENWQFFCYLQLSKEQIARQESNEELKALKNELLDSLATTAAQQELRIKYEQELALLKKSLEEESGHHESQLMEMRHKHSQELAVLHEQMDNAKKIKAALEKAKVTLEAENADMANEIKSILTSKAETDRKRKHLESQVSELTSRLQESEGARSEVQDRLVRIQTDMESLTAQLVDAESRSVNATKSNANTEQQLNEMQTQLEVETKQKLALNAKIRQLESEKESLHYQVEDAEGAKEFQGRVVIDLEKKLRNFDKILAEEKAISERFASKRDAAERDAREKETKVFSLSRDLEEYIVKVEELERSRRVLQNELDELANSRGTADKNYINLLNKIDVKINMFTYSDKFSPISRHSQLFLENLRQDHSFALTNSKTWRDDQRCGSDFYLPDDPYTIAQCNPVGSFPCCSHHGWCGWDKEWCECDGCIDYRTLRPVTDFSPHVSGMHGVVISFEIPIQNDYVPSFELLNYLNIEGTIFACIIVS